MSYFLCLVRKCNTVHSSPVVKIINSCIAIYLFRIVNYQNVSYSQILILQSSIYVSFCIG